MISNKQIKALVNERMVYEVGKSVEVAYGIAPLLDYTTSNLKYMQILRPKWESNKALQQAIGYILGMGYQFKIKNQMHMPPALG
jgi:predicted RNase H-related nuclease YkuK (DUF458 family)